MRLGIRGKVLTSLFLLIALGISGLAYVSFQYMKTTTDDLMKKQVDSGFESARSLMNLLVPGEWETVNGKLVKGSVTINDNNELVDGLARRLKIDGVVVTFLHDDIRVATTLIENGKRAVGTKLSPEVKHKTVDLGEDFVGVTNVLGERYYAVYKPVRNPEGDVKGIFVVAQPAKHSDQAIAKFMKTIVWISGSLIAVMLLAVFFLTSGMIRVVKRVGAVCQKVASGDLRVQDLTVRSKDELGQLTESVNRMTASLRSFVTRTDEAASHVEESAKQLYAGASMTRTATEEITQLVQTLSAGSEEQVSASEESAASIQQLAESGKEIAGAADMLFHSLESMSHDAEDGKSAAQAAVLQMGVIREAVGNTSSSIEELDQMSAEIEEIAKVIGGIASQTDLLALNASIEAARAGEHGRGFAVVADEIRKLSHQTEVSSGKIKELIERTIHVSRQAATSMSKSLAEFAEGVKRVETAESSFRSIADSTSSLTERMEVVSRSVERMSVSSDAAAGYTEEILATAQQASDQMGETAALAEENLAAMEQVTQTSMALQDLARDLNQAVETFRR